MDADDIAAGQARWQAALRRRQQATPTSRRCPARRSSRSTARPSADDRIRADRLARASTRSPAACTPSGYRGKPWTIRQFAGFGNAAADQRALPDDPGRGRRGLSVAFDMPTLMGRDSDDPRSLGEVGHCGVAIDRAADMEVLFDGIPLGDVTTSMTISGPAVPGLLHVPRRRRAAGRRHRPS